MIELRYLYYGAQGNSILGLTFIKRDFLPTNTNFTSHTSLDLYAWTHALGKSV